MAPYADADKIKSIVGEARLKSAAPKETADLDALLHGDEVALAPVEPRRRRQPVPVEDLLYEVVIDMGEVSTGVRELSPSQEALQKVSCDLTPLSKE